MALAKYSASNTGHLQGELFLLNVGCLTFLEAVLLEELGYSFL